MKKLCRKCLEEKSLDNFFKAPENADKLSNQCKSCKIILQREYRTKVGNASTHKYEKTKKGFLVRLYRNMQSRISGVQKEKFHLYEGKEILGRKQFYAWAFDSDEFHKLFGTWEKSGYSQRRTPSVDRINSSRGYDIDNMEWVTHSENSSRGARSRFDKVSNVL